MPGAWIEIIRGGEKRREPLREGLTRLGGAGTEIVVEEAGSDQLHLWDSPARVVFVGGGEAPTRGGVRIEEAALLPGDQFEWRGLKFVFGGGVAGAPAAIEEIPVVSSAPTPARAMVPAPIAPSVTPPGVAPAATGATPAPIPGLGLGGDDRAWHRLRAGMLLDLQLADRRSAKRWQQTVLSGGFDADACARDIEAGSEVPVDDYRILERAGRLLRDFLMAPYQAGMRGAGRRARQRVRGGFAFILAQGMALLAFFVLAGIALVVARYKGADINGFLDLILMRD